MLNNFFSKIAELHIKLGENVSDFNKQRIRIPSLIPGGPAKKKYEDQFNPIKLYVGAVEETKEHTTPDHMEYGVEIAADHLTKDPSYYDDELTKQNIQKASYLIKKIRFNQLKTNITQPK